MSDPASGPGPVRLAASLEGPAAAPVLVLGNSLGTTLALWGPQVAALRQHFRLLRYEHRGHGSGGPGTAGWSPAPAGPYAIDELGRDVLALLDAHGIERALYCGISLGGMVGMWLAANAPDRIAGLGLCCTSAFLPPAAMWAGRAAQVRSAGMRSVVDQSLRRWFTPAFRSAEPATIRAFGRSLEGITAEGYAGCCEAVAGMDLRAALKSIGVPTLVIAGAEDQATPPWHGAVIASGIRNSRLIVVRGASHLANVAAAGQVTTALLGHLLGACA